MLSLPGQCHFNTCFSRESFGHLSSTMHQSVGTHPNPAFCYPLLGRDEMKETHVPASSEILRDTPPASASNLQTGGDLIQAVSFTAS